MREHVQRWWYAVGMKKNFQKEAEFVTTHSMTTHKIPNVLPIPKSRGNKISEVSNNVAHASVLCMKRVKTVDGQWRITKKCHENIFLQCFE